MIENLILKFYKKLLRTKSEGLIDIDPRII